MAKLSISKAWEQTLSLLRQDGRLFIAVALAFFVLPQTILGAVTPATPDQATASFFWLLLLALLLALAGQIAINRLAIPPGATVAIAIKRGIERILVLLVALVIVFVAIGLLFLIFSLVLVATAIVSSPVAGQPPPGALIFVLLLVIGMLYSIFQLTIPISAAEVGGPIHLLRRAWELGKRSYWRLVAFLVVVIIGLFIFWAVAQVTAGLAVTAILGPSEAGSVGAILISFVVAVTQAAWNVVTALMIARIYVQLAGERPAEASVPHSGT